jgi:conjugal transfer pilus assembly protein TraW
MVVRAVLLATMCFSANVFAENLGSFGPTYPIKERAIDEVLAEKLSQITPEQKRKLDEKIRSIFEEKMQSPTSVDLPRNAQYHSRLFNPSIVLSEDIKDHNENVLIKAGSTVNPLDHTRLGNDLLFYDATDPQQLAWAEKQTANGTHILIKGSPLKLMEKWQQRIYFDQGGKLSKRFGLTGVPSKISQSGKMLRIEACVP